MMRTITIVGKGPSAVHAQKWIDREPGSDVAILNEAGLILRPRQRIRFGFFCHARFAALMRPSLWDRVECFVRPFQLIGPQELPPDFPRHKQIFYQGNQCGGTRKALLDRINSGGITHHHTITAAMTWLAKIGYRKIRIIGIGGKGYAPGFAGTPKLPEDPAVWPRVESILAGILKDLYRVKVEKCQ